MTFISYAQNFEDVMLYRALKHIDKGFFVDVGANDPIIDSVSYAFYKLGWQGINIEPMRPYYERLCSTRPLDINLPVAVADADGELVMYNIPGTGLSTLEKEIAQKHLAAGRLVEEKKVPVQTLNQIFEEYVDGPIHFLKIDVEGAEKTVLQGLDLSRWRPWILVIEATVPMSQDLNYASWESLVTGAEYEMVYFDGLNRFYLAQEQMELAELFETPPNYFDDFFPHSDERLSMHYESMLTELDRNRSELNGKIGELNGVQAELEMVRNDRENLRADLDSVREDRGVIRSELEIVRQERDAIHSELEIVRQERDAIHSELEISRSEQDAAHSQLNEVNDSLDDVRLELNEVRGERDKTRAKLDEVWADRDKVLILLDQTRTERDQTRQELDEVWADRHRYWAELDEVYTSLHWRLSAPFRALFRKLRAWKERLSRILHRPFSQNVAKAFRRIAVILRRTSWGNNLLNKIKVRNSKLWYRVVSWMKRTDPAESTKEMIVNIPSNDDQFSKKEKHFLSLFQRELDRRQNNFEDNK